MELQWLLASNNIFLVGQWLIHVCVRVKYKDQRWSRVWVNEPWRPTTLAVTRSWTLEQTTRTTAAWGSFIARFTAFIHIFIIMFYSYIFIQWLFAHEYYYIENYPPGLWIVIIINVIIMYCDHTKQINDVCDYCCRYTPLALNPIQWQTV